MARRRPTEWAKWGVVLTIMLAAVQAVYSTGAAMERIRSLERRDAMLKHDIDLLRGELSRAGIPSPARSRPP